MWKLMYAQTEQAVSAASAEAAKAAEAAQNAAQTTPGAANGQYSLFVMIAVFFAIMYFLMIRPQQKRDKERKAMLNSLTKGDKVVTSGGICGTIVNLTENHAVVKVDDNVKIEFVRSAVIQVLSREGEKKAK